MSGVTNSTNDQSKRDPVVAPRLAATLIVVRDNPQGMQVLLLRRVKCKGDPVSNAYVFPGGAVDHADSRLHAWCAGHDDETASARLQLPGGGLDFYIAAIRECFEEAGLLFACDSSLTITNLQQISASVVADWRAAIRNGGAGFRQVCEQFGVRLAVDRLVYHSHWLTPPGQPKRFDTRFFIAEMPAGQTAALDSDETVEHCWIRPVDALHAGSDMALPRPTRVTLESIAHFATVAECMEHAKQRRNIGMIMARMGYGQRGPLPILPGEAAYAEIAHIDPYGEQHASYELLAGRAVQLSNRIWRVTAPNGNMMTGPGTNTYLIGERDSNEWAVIDPGPADDSHVRAILAAAPGRISRIFVTHTHMDHSPAAAALKACTGAQLFGRTASHPERQDTSFMPDIVLRHGDGIRLGDAATLRVLHTPGHASNHLCYFLLEEKTLFTGDHVMQGSSVMISPPDGDMTLYVDSLRALLGEDLEWLAPGHGFLMAEPHTVISGLIRHRSMREAKIINALHDSAPIGLQCLLERVYDDVPSQLHPAARRSLLAHLLKLEADGLAAETGGNWQPK